MLTSYIALTSRRGLEAFLPETDQDAPELARRTRCGPELCYWTVLADDDARRVGRTLAAGEPAAALALLDRAAAYAGPVLPTVG
ncbi:MAG: hypothetical protein K2X82_33935 [Gemmataceae bacterium]|nr:hypothetical protein [Gemmataceae bacterium]